MERYAFWQSGLFASAPNARLAQLDLAVRLYFSVQSRRPKCVIIQQ